MKEEYDLVVIGGGIAGCTAAIYAGMSGRKVSLYVGPLMGGLISTTKIVDNYTGLPGIDGMKMAEDIIEHAKKYSTVIYDQVEKIYGKVVQSSMKSVKAKAIVIATGSSPKKLGLYTEKVFENRGVSYCAICDGYFFKDKIVAVVGGGNSAFEQVKYLSSLCKTVYLIHRNNKFRAFDSLQKDVFKLKNVIIKPNAEIEEFMGQEDLQMIKLKGTDEIIHAQGAFISIGHYPNSWFTQVEKDQEGYIIVKKNYETSERGIFACGDVIHNPHMARYKQAMVAGGEGCIAGLEAVKYIEDTEQGMIDLS